jgi:hypothetical protein
MQGVEVDINDREVSVPESVSPSVPCQTEQAAAAAAEEEEKGGP